MDKENEFPVYYACIKLPFLKKRKVMCEAVPEMMDLM